MDTYNGYLFSKLHLIGSKSEGPTYYVQQYDYKERPVVKKAYLSETDATLHPFLNKKVTIGGELTLDGIVYESIEDYMPQGPVAPDYALELDLQIPDPVWVNKQRPGPHPCQGVHLTLLVKWPNKSIWEGRCPTTQIYDFVIERDGKTFWRWSDERFFLPVLTPVLIPGGRWHKFHEIWKLDPDDVMVDGKYTLHALFIAAGQTVSKDFDIKLVRKEHEVVATAKA